MRTTTLLLSLSLGLVIMLIMMATVIRTPRPTFVSAKVSRREFIPPSTFKVHRFVIDDRDEADRLAGYFPGIGQRPLIDLVDITAFWAGNYDIQFTDAAGSTYALKLSLYPGGNLNRWGESDGENALVPLDGSEELAAFLDRLEEKYSETEDEPLLEAAQTDGTAKSE